MLKKVKRLFGMVKKLGIMENLIPRYKEVNIGIGKGVHLVGQILLSGM